MQTQEIPLLDGEFDINVPFPSTMEEMTKVLGTEAAVIDEAVDNLLYRNWYPRVYKAVSKAIADKGTEATPGPDFAKRQAVDKAGNPKTTTLKDKTVKPVLESDMDHIRGFIAVDPTGANKAKAQALFESIAPTSPLYVEGEGRGGGGKISQAALDGANALIAANSTEQAVTMIESKVTGYKVGRDTEGNVTPESLARAIMALEKFIQKESQKAAKALLGGLTAPTEAPAPAA